MEKLTAVEKRKRTMARLYGPDFYKKIGQAGGKAVMKKYGPEYFSKIGKKGGTNLVKSRGIEFFRQIARKSRKGISE